MDSNPKYMTLLQIAEAAGFTISRVARVMKVNQIIADITCDHRKLYGPAKTAAIIGLAHWIRRPVSPGRKTSRRPNASEKGK